MLGNSGRKMIDRHPLTISAQNSAPKVEYEMSPKRSGRTTGAPVRRF